jgi:uncharacterized protein YdeI (YjbR/CyaY-like superfamily)
MNEEVYISNRIGWRKWLTCNHDRSAGVWLVFYRLSTRKPTLAYEDAVEEALCFGWIDSIIRKLDAERYVRKFTPRKQGSSWSESNRRRISRLLEQDRMTERGMAAVRDAKASGAWFVNDLPVIPDEVPAELEAALAENPAAKMFFESLAPSYRRRFVAWVAMARRDETRTARVRESIELLAKREKLGLK